VKKIVLGLVLVLVNGICASAQTIKIVDNTDPQVTLSGTVTFTDGYASCYLMATNQSPLLLKDIVVRIKITRPDGQSAEFGFSQSHSMQDLVKRGGQMPVGMGACPFDTDLANNQKATTNPAGATARILAIRFSDGTIWGNPRELLGLDAAK